MHYFRRCMILATLLRAFLIRWVLSLCTWCLAWWTDNLGVLFPWMVACDKPFQTATNMERFRRRERRRRTRRDAHAHLLTARHAFCLVWYALHALHARARAHYFAALRAHTSLRSLSSLFSCLLSISILLALHAAHTPTPARARAALHLAAAAAAAAITLWTSFCCRSRIPSSVTSSRRMVL